jgi:hypothetical protein
MLKLKKKGGSEVHAKIHKQDSPKIVKHIDVMQGCSLCITSKCLLTATSSNIRQLKKKKGATKIRNHV